MASIARRCLFSSYRSARRISSRSVSQPAKQWQRSLSCTTARRADKAPWDQAENEEGEDLSEQEARWAQLAEDVSKIDPKFQARAAMKYLDDFEMVEEEDYEIAKDDPKAIAQGFWGEGEEEDGGPDEDYYGDDITSLGHGELEQHRELREYARLAAWELPLLSQLAKPFQLPTAATPFRFRYTSYLGEKHPAANKVVVEYSVADMPDMNQKQRDKLIKLAGPRYNPGSGIIKMSCEMFDTQDQNKRFLGETIKKLLDEAKDLKEDFSDVPFDFRHHKLKVRPQFPAEWALTPERKQYLEEKRRKQQQIDYERDNLGTLTDGKKIIEQALPNILPSMPEMVAAPNQRLRR
ncbi:hypothetical protein GQ43DRAFT_411237 [Delitschia confertaspora ATCC 74209]|uniref:Small ribosomal subunit protein mS35 mitochondrial conserved domain-containing protein n=1 Tax=Delitschia confertaspora ATCC 74209 TaxID=1513339 RepID=A0A9P4JUI1_9PLEO|nr:hypothetical protein GQ43DRAFT_411237 [Delitschia confertaspora ATCC 74209]